MELRDYEKNAVFAILVRQIEMQEEKAEAEKLAAAAKERVDAASAVLTRIRPALSVFGFDPSSQTFWDEVKAVLGTERYKSAFEVAKKNESHERGSVDNDDTQDREDDIDDTEKSESEVDLDESRSLKVRDLILDHLKSFGDEGAKIGEIKAFIASQGIETHEKTAGMTLYRLSKDHLVRRDGRVWIYVASKSDKEEEEPADSNVARGSSAGNLL